MLGHSGTRKRPSKRQRNRTRNLLLVHSINTVLSLCSAGLFIATVPIWNANFYYKASAVQIDWPDLLASIPLATTFTTSLVYVVRHIRKGKPANFKPRNTGKAAVPSPSLTREKSKLAASLLVIVMLLGFLVLSAVSGVYRFWQPAPDGSATRLASKQISDVGMRSLITVSKSIEGSNPTSTSANAAPFQTTPKAIPDSTKCSMANIFTRACNPTLYVIGDLQIAAISTGCAVWILSVLLFILHVREYQHLKRKIARSHRKQAKSKSSDKHADLDSAEKGSCTESVTDQSSNPSSWASASSPEHSIRVPSPLVVRPKQHYYNPNIVGRTRSQRTQTPYGKAVREARQSARPTLSMRQWMTDRTSRTP